MTSDISFCRKLNSAKSATIWSDSENHSFAFGVSNLLSNNDNNLSSVNSVSYPLLVDCGATVHIVNDESKFIKFDKIFDTSTHMIQLADGSTQSDIVQEKGDVSILLQDKYGQNHNVL